MKIVFFLLSIFLLIPSVCIAEDSKPLYSLPSLNEAKAKKKSSSKSQNKVQKTISKNEAKNILLATDSGLYRIINESSILPLWTESNVKQILPVENENGIECYYFLTGKGVLFSKDLSSFETRNNGLPFLVIKKYDGEKTSFENQCQDIKDICVNPLNHQDIVITTRDEVFISRDGGYNWKSISSPSVRTNGIKACAIATVKIGKAENVHNETLVFLSHAIFGLHYYSLDAKKPDWKDCARGLSSTDPSNSCDEVADILPISAKDADGNLYAEIFLSQTFMPRLYHYDTVNEKSTCVYKGGEPLDTIDALYCSGNKIIFMTPGAIKTYDISSGKVNEVGNSENASVDLNNTIRENSKGKENNFDLVLELIKDFSRAPSTVNAAFFPSTKHGLTTNVLLNEFWLYDSGKVLSPYAQKIECKKSLYVPAYQAHLPGGIEKFKKLILDNKLNSLVIDMKDDYGLLRYDAQNPLVTQKGVVSKYALNLEKFVSEYKKEDIYLIARIPVFKDRNLANYNSSLYAVWDKTTNCAWTGIKNREKQEDGSVKINYYDESWVDPYCPEVWEYNVAIAQELIERGFDEIQFDYIRFPTDGTNLYNASYRWKSDGMDKEGALRSFMSYARENINAPIGIDIYGANGWYRSGTRTGQDVETLSEYVDVICPMFYPSHFEHSFLNYPPNEERPYRIYYYGTYRNSVIARDRVVVRPWVQAFFLNVPYDRAYYDESYVAKEVFGVRDSVDRGYMFWNNGGNYSKISPDPGDTPYKGKSFEADTKFRKPALGVKKEITPPPISMPLKENLDVLDYLLNQDTEFAELLKDDDSSFFMFNLHAPFLRIHYDKKKFGGIF